MLDDVAIIAISGELDLALCVKVALDLDAALHSPVRALVIDLEAVCMVDSSGIALLLNAFRQLDEGGRQLSIACPMGPQRRAFELTAIDRELPMYESREDALAAVGPADRHPNTSGRPPTAASAAAAAGQRRSPPIWRLGGRAEVRADAISRGRRCDRIAARASARGSPV